MATNSSLNTSTNSAALISNSSGVPTWSGTMTNGQVVIGSTGATPTAATLTQGTGIAITNGAGTITIAASGANAPISPWVQIQQQTTAGSQTTVSFTTGLTTYNQLMLTWSGAILANNMYIAGSINGGSTYPLGADSAVVWTNPNSVSGPSQFNPFPIAGGATADTGFIVWDNQSGNMIKPFNGYTKNTANETGNRGLFTSGGAQWNAFQLTCFGGAAFPNGEVLTLFGR